MKSVINEEWVAKSLDIPSLIGVGETQIEAVAELEEAIKIYLGYEHFKGAKLKFSSSYLTLYDTEDTKEIKKTVFKYTDNEEKPEYSTDMIIKLTLLKNHNNKEINLKRDK